MAASQRARALVEQGPVAPEDCQIGAKPGQCVGNRRTDAAGGSGDQGVLTGERGALYFAVRRGIC